MIERQKGRTKRRVEKMARNKSGKASVRAKHGEGSGTKTTPEMMKEIRGEEKLKA